MTTMHMLKSVKDTIDTPFIIKSEGSLIVFDGGYALEGENMAAKINELGGTVDGWFLTHPHDDHIGCADYILANHPEIKIKNLYFNFFPLEFYATSLPVDKNSYDLIPLFLEKADKAGRVTVHKGDVFEFDGFKVTVLREPNPEITENVYNNSSVVYRVDTPNKSVIFLGDLGVEGGEELVSQTPPELLSPDYLQMAHHGQNGVNKETYFKIKPKACLWCTPTWLWDNMGPEGYDTGIFNTVVTRGWISELRVSKHYVMQQGPFEIEL